MMKHYDYIIIGGGASGLLLAYHMANDPFFDTKKILILEKAKKTANDRTWCFWESPKGEFDALVFKHWEYAMFKGNRISRSFSLHPFVYKMIRSADFYRFMHRHIERKSNMIRKIDEVMHVTDTEDFVVVKTKEHHYRSDRVFSSIFDMDLLYKQKKYPVLQQHFLGWYIQTDEDVFDDDTITFMDFTVPQQSNTRFMYVLPFSKTEALVEYTLFSECLLPAEAYEQALKTYLERENITHYRIVEKEQGSIPMTCYNFSKHNSKRIFYIGTAGGWTKPSTGYTFLNMVRKTRKLTQLLKKGKVIAKRNRKSRFWYYDLLLLDILHRRNDMGSQIFSAIFKRNSPKHIFRFLDEQTSLLGDLRIITSLRPYPFLKSLFKRIF